MNWDDPFVDLGNWTNENNEKVLCLNVKGEAYTSSHTFTTSVSSAYKNSKGAILATKMRQIVSKLLKINNKCDLFVDVVYLQLFANFVNH